jgi:hypothetical protein
MVRETINLIRENEDAVRDHAGDRDNVVAVIFGTSERTTQIDCGAEDMIVVAADRPDTVVIQNFRQLMVGSPNSLSHGRYLAPSGHNYVGMNRFPIETPNCQET